MDCHSIINVISVPYKHAGILHVCYYIVLLCHMDGNVLVIKLSVSLGLMADCYPFGIFKYFLQ